MQTLWNQFLSILFPEHCIGCGRGGTALCALCERTITGKPTALSRSTAALFDYKNPLVKKAIWALKYDRHLSLGNYFGIALYREFFKHLARSSGKSGDIYIIPVPSSSGTLRERGDNHAEKIAESIVKCAAKDGFLLVADAHILYKEKETKRQVETKDKKERLANLRGAFAVKNAERIEGKTVVLIDDVITTGATLREARAVLKAFGPKRILAIAVAH